jgi:thiosulfate/3-mercaptopyruvate sulfurtransferase
MIDLNKPPIKGHSSLVTTEWLEKYLLNPDIRLIDATWFHPSKMIMGFDEYKKSHIPGAIFFDLDEQSDHQSSLPHMLPDVTKFASYMRRLGISNGHHIIVYDRASGGSAAARLWWMLRYFGHDRISLLDGGYEKWLNEYRPVNNSFSDYQERHFIPKINPHLLRNKEAMMKNITTQKEQVLDARSTARFYGREIEPWPHKKKGHIPKSLSLPWTELIDPHSKEFISLDMMKQKFLEASLDLNRPIVTTCGSGVTACLLAFALHLLGRDDVAIYDGSWAEWGMADDTIAELSS